MQARPATGPSAMISGPVVGGSGNPFIGSPTIDVGAQGYGQSEFFADGTAQSYQPVGPQDPDGRWTVAPGASATYRTRILVRRPTDAHRFNGTVLVEWLNVSGGVDADPDFSYMRTELMRSGYAWVGMSVQQIGVSGGNAVVRVKGVPTGGLRAIDPARYASLHHPGDAYALDMFSQVGRALRLGGSIDPLGGLRPERLAAIGESQSAFELTTINAIQPRTRVFDGFFVHSRGGGAVPLAGGNIVSGISGGTHLRDDTDVPVLMFETETDEALLRYYDARQADTALIRLWDVAGAAHADAYLVGNVAALIGCGNEINNAPTHYVVDAALSQFGHWLRTGTPPPSAPRLQVSTSTGRPVVQRNVLGNAVGGLRTPAVDVPVAALSGVPADASNVLCSLFGSAHPFDGATLERLYPAPGSYLAAFTAALDTTINNGYLLPADRAQLLAEAGAVRI